MTAVLGDMPIPRVEIPDSDRVRRRLAVVLTEAAVLRSQLRVSARLDRERERLRRLAGADTALESGGRRDG